MFHRFRLVFPSIARGSASWLDGKNFTVQIE
jgi:hypothetical protein